MTDHTSTRMTAREKAVWDATFAAAFVEQTRRAYDATEQMGQQSRLYGLGFSECALEDAASNAEVARGGQRRGLRAARDGGGAGVRDSR